MHSNILPAEAGQRTTEICTGLHVIKSELCTSSPLARMDLSRICEWSNESTHSLDPEMQFVQLIIQAMRRKASYTSTHLDYWYPIALVPCPLNIVMAMSCSLTIIERAISLKILLPLLLPLLIRFFYSCTSWHAALRKSCCLSNSGCVRWAYTRATLGISYAHRPIRLSSASTQFTAPST